MQIDVLVVIAIIIGVLLLLGLILVGWQYYRSISVRKHLANSKKDKSDTSHSNGFVRTTKNVITSEPLKVTSYSQSSQSSGSRHEVEMTSATLYNATEKPLSIPGHLELYSNEILLGEKIGEGGCADIKIVQVTPNNSAKINGYQKLAAKIFKTTVKLSNEMFQNELAIMNDLKDFDKCVKIVGYCLNPPMIIMPFYTKGTLKDLYENKETPDAYYTSVYVQPLLRDLASALEFMHNNGLSHNDVKPANVLLDNHPTKNRTMAVLSDFSITTVFRSSKLGVHSFNFTDIKGLSVQYLAPELVQKLNITMNLFPMRTKTREEAETIEIIRPDARDVYAFAITAFEVLTRISAWVGMTREKICRAVLNEQRPDISHSLPPKFKQLMPIIDACWKHDPNLRPNMSVIAKTLAEMY